MICLIYSLLFLNLRIFLFINRLNFILFDNVIFLELELFSINSCNVLITILLDWISLLFIRFVLFISSIVIYYRKEYIDGDLNIERFIILVCLFVLSIMLLIIRPNLIRILLGWDGLGLVSYCLVIYYQNIKSYNAGILTALRNRIGDVALLIAIAWIINYGRWNYIFYLDFMKNDFIIKFIIYIVILAAITKRAQIPFSSWLPAAIAAPTPVSSLVHSSTLVTAGVYLLIRFNFALDLNISILILFISTLTIFIAGLGANFEYDLKKIIALSTLRQLGLIMSIICLGEYKLALFHLLTHALFKALLFICAGAIIHNYMNCQDIRFIGRLVIFIPLTCSFFIICNLALCGLPFLSGFYSKDLILEFISINIINIYIYLIYFISTGLTVSYTFRLLYYVVIGDFNYLPIFKINDLGFIILKSIVGLILLVIIGGRILIWTIFARPIFICLPFFKKIITLFVIILGIIIGIEIRKFYLFYKLKSLKYLRIVLFFSNIWNIPFISTNKINYYFLRLGKIIYLNIDQGWSEYLGSQNIFNKLRKSSLFIQILFNNNLKLYLILFLLLSLIIIIIYLDSLNKTWYWRYQDN